MLRFNPIVAAVARLAREGVFGRLRRFHVENYAQADRVPVGHWVWDSSVSGGTMIEHAIHFFDMVHFCGVRKPVRVNGMRELDSKGRERFVSASVLYEEGVIAPHNHPFAGPGAFEDTTLHFGFDLARIDVEGWVPVRGHITALVNDETRKRLTVLPGIAVRRELPIDEAPDESRPEGWGDPPTIDDNMAEQTSREHDPLHQVDTLIKGRFEVGRPKSAVYADCVRYVMTDLVSKIQNPKHRQRVTLEDGLLALEVAYRAAVDSRRKTP
jgi:predicted dehydrogenase